MKAFVNGQLVPLDAAMLSIHDAGVQHAVGLFETMQAFNGRVFRLVSHIERLIQSARQTGLSRSLRLEPLCDLVESTLGANGLSESRIRLTVTGGDMALLAAARDRQRPAEHQPGVICVASAPTQYPAQFFDEGVSVVIADARANPLDPLAGHKTLNYWLRLRALADAAGRQAGEALWLAVSNHLVGGSVSNAFLVRDGKLLTPIARGEEADGALPSPVLPGITRTAVIDIARDMDIQVDRRMLSIDDLLGADEVFLTNSSWQVLPIVRVEDKVIAAGRPGEMTGRLRAKLLDAIADETK
jgi:branched-subunit amino acid aminotransferase/4-amino-4-deoxychorismate lyase